jgi:hypothetical protein
MDSVTPLQNLSHFHHFIVTSIHEGSVALLNGTSVGEVKPVVKTRIGRGDCLPHAEEREEAEGGCCPQLVWMGVAPMPPGAIPGSLA